MTAAGLCCDSDAVRRALVRGKALNGIDSVEVDCAQTVLTVTFLGRAPDWLTPAHLRIEGGRRERDLRILDIRLERAEDDGLDDRLFVTLDRHGDFSTYRLVIVALDANGRPTGKPPADFDPRYASAAFGFKAGCPSDQDPADVAPCPPIVTAAPAIDYLAKDYQTFRQLMLDRLALTLPGWTERHVPDLGITLVELFAWVADQLSYYQDAVATEAYLDTARRRASVRRHCRLVDYRLDDGQSAQGWAALTLSAADEQTLVARDLMLTTALPGREAAMLRDIDLAGIPESAYLVFEPDAGLDAIIVRRAHNAIVFHDWGGAECCLPIGATAATLRDPGKLPPEPEPRPDDGCDDDEPPPPDRAAGIASGRWHLLRLAPGNVLILAEVVGPRTGAPADADPLHRQAVRLTAATFGWDPVTGDLIVDIAWCPEDALTFPLCLTTTTAAPACRALSGVSVAYGNIIPVGHGRGVVDTLGTVGTAAVLPRCDEPCAPAETMLVPQRFHPALPRPEPSLVVLPTRFNPDTGCGGCGAAAASRRGEAGTAIPAVAVTSRIADSDPGQAWSPRTDLLDSGPDDRHFVVEIGDDGGAALRFGDGRNGRTPAAGERFTAAWRTGSGPRGNIGAAALRHLVFRDGLPDGVALTVDNPLPARGGRAPEPVAVARLRAPHAFRSRLERAVTAADYAAIVMRDFPGVVQRAAATLRATGVRRTVLVAIDPRGRADADPALLACIARHLDGYRRIGHDVRVVPARQVALDLALTVCVTPDQLAEHVGVAVRAALGAGSTPRGGRGFFHPDALSFGEPVALSRIVAAVHAVDGVAHVEVTRLERLFEGPNGELADGVLRLGPTEIARLDQDPDAPENGRLCLAMRGGR